MTLEERLKVQKEVLERAQQQVIFLTGTVAILEELIKEQQEVNKDAGR